jgi:hypothetical protein
MSIIPGNIFPGAQNHPELIMQKAAVDITLPKFLKIDPQAPIISTRAGNSTPLWKRG